MGYRMRGGAICCGGRKSVSRSSVYPPLARVALMQTLAGRARVWYPSPPPIRLRFRRLYRASTGRADMGTDATPSARFWCASTSLILFLRCALKAIRTRPTCAPERTATRDGRSQETVTECGGCPGASLT